MCVRSVIIALWKYLGGPVCETLQMGTNDLNTLTQYQVGIRAMLISDTKLCDKNLTVSLFKLFWHFGKKKLAKCSLQTLSLCVFFPYEPFIKNLTWFISQLTNIWPVVLEGFGTFRSIKHYYFVEYYEWQCKPHVQCL